MLRDRLRRPLTEPVCRQVWQQSASEGCTGRCHSAGETSEMGNPSRLLDDEVDLGQRLAALLHVVVTGASGLCHTHELTNVKAAGELDGIVVADRPLFRYVVAPAIPACIGMTNATSRCP